MFEVRHYQTATGTDVIAEWLKALRDTRARARIAIRIERLGLGNFGDSRYLADGVAELRIDYGPGYRVYYGRVGEAVILLLCGGDKRTQQADISRAVDYLKDYQQRTRP